MSDIESHESPLNQDSSPESKSERSPGAFQLAASPVPSPPHQTSNDTDNEVEEQGQEPEVEESVEEAGEQQAEVTEHDDDDEHSADHGEEEAPPTKKPRTEEYSGEPEPSEPEPGSPLGRVEALANEDSDEEPDNEGGGSSGMSDWDVMMQKRKDAMARARKRRKRDMGHDLSHDEHIQGMITQMKIAAEDDRHLNIAREAATKKMQMLPTVVTHLKKVDLVGAFMDNDILSALADWVAPLPDHSLPHLKIRESILDILKTFPTPSASVLKESKIGKSVMLLYRHPKETRKNREKAGKIINEWARPIFGLASDFKTLSRDEREERDYAHLSQSKRKRMSTGERRPSQEEDFEAPQKPGDRGWVGRARVPMPSTNDYVVRPKASVELKMEGMKKSSKKVLNRYEKQLQKEKQRKTQNKTTHAISISVEGRNMPL